MTRALGRRRSERPTGVLVAVIAYVVLLHWVYEVKIAPLFAYAGLTYRTPRPDYYAVTIVVTVVLALLLPRQIRRPSDLILWLLFTFAVAPCLLVSQYNLILAPDAATRFGLVAAACFGLIRAATLKELPTLRVRRKRRRQPLGAWLWPVLALVSLSNYLLLAAIVGIHVGYLSFSNVYSVRSDFITSAGSFPLIGYLVPLQYGVINPLYIGYGIVKRRPLMLGAGVLGQLLIYASEGEKSVLFAIPAVAAVAWSLRAGRPLAGVNILNATTVVAATCALVDVLNHSAALTSLFTRRSLVVPGILATAYNSIFRNRPKTHFSEFLPVTNPYPSNPPSHIVGQLFGGDATTNANVSWLGHGFLSWGYSGMVIESLVIALLLLLADTCCRGLPLWVSCSLFFMPAIALCSASVFTATLTNGLAAALLVGWRMPRNRRLSTADTALWTAHLESDEAAPAIAGPAAPVAERIEPQIERIPTDSGLRG